MNKLISLSLFSLFFALQASTAFAYKGGGLDCWCHGEQTAGVCNSYKCACAAPNGKCPSSAINASVRLKASKAKWEFVKIF